MTAIKTATCTRCKRSTNFPQLLSNMPRSFRRSNTVMLACPGCIARAQTNLYWVMCGFYAVVAFAFIAMSTSPNGEDIANGPAPIILFGIFAFLFEPIMMVLHEAAHAAVGRLLGLRVFGVHLGSGPIIHQIRVKNFLVTLHLVPAGGLCRLMPRFADGRQWRFAISIAAGPLVHIVALVGLILFVWTQIGVSIKAFCTSPWIPAFFWVNLLMLIANLIPRDFRRDGQVMANDGKLVLQLARCKPNGNEWLTSRYATEIETCLETGHVSDARTWLQRAQSLAGNSQLVRFVELHVLGAERKWAEVRKKAMEWQSSCSDPLEKSAISAWAAVATVYDGGDLAEAEALCSQSMATEPWNPSIQTVRALVSLAQEREAEAEAFLREAGTPTNWAAKAAAAHLWVVIYQRKGRPSRQRKWEERASALDPTGSLLPPFAPAVSAKTQSPAPASPAS